MWHTKAQTGFSLLASLVFMVAIASLIALLLETFSLQTAENVLFLRNRQAYYAAMAGVEWAAHRIQAAETHPVSPGAYACPASTSFAMPSNAAAAPFTVTVNCTLLTTPATSYAVHAYQIQSTASTGAVNSKQFVQQSVSHVLYYSTG